MGVFERPRRCGGYFDQMRIDNLKLPVTATDEDALKSSAKRARIKLSDVKAFRVIKKSIDARDKNDVKFVYNTEIDIKPFEDEKEFSIPASDKRPRILVVGFGPAGMFCALFLARAGYNPVVIERGKSVDERKKSVEAFAKFGTIDPESNVQFGEGGAGTFSDGKLNTGVSGTLIKTVLREFVKHGAPVEIEYSSKPHIGSDKLPETVKNIRIEIERLGGKVLFGKKLEKFVVKGEKITAAIVNGEEIPVDDVVLAVGHSARDTFYELGRENVAMERKQFAMGFRIEHKREFIDEAQYGKKFAGFLPAADYRLTSHKAQRGVFTFCMCPGGVVIPSASEIGGVVTNGMSLYARDEVNSNSAVLCEIYPSDFYEGVLGGVELQREIERKAFLLGGSDYSAPTQKLEDFYAIRRTERFGSVRPTYERNMPSDLNGLFPPVVTESIKTGISDMNNKLKGFSCGDAVLTGVETRSSSPVRILRGDDMVSPTVGNLYPCGEGCGYAGGITSAAVDGIKVAAAIAEKYSKKS